MLKIKKKKVISNKFVLNMDHGKIVGCRYKYEKTLF